MKYKIFWKAWDTYFWLKCFSQEGTFILKRNKLMPILYMNELCVFSSRRHFHHKNKKLFIYFVRGGEWNSFTYSQK